MSTYALSHPADQYPEPDSPWDVLPRTNVVLMSDEDLGQSEAYDAGEAAGGGGSPALPTAGQIWPRPFSSQ